MKKQDPGVASVLARLRHPLEVILTCVCWYAAYPLSLRHLQEMTAEHGIAVDQSAVHRWAIKLPPVLEKAFRRCKRAVGESWRMDETYVKIRSEWMCLYPAVDKEGNTVDFLLRASGTRLLPSVISKIDPAKRRTGDGDDRQKRS